MEIRRGLVVASVYLPNGNPQPGPKLDYKLAWCERFNAHARDVLASGKPAILAGDLNVVPTKADIYNEWLWREDAVVQPETRAAFRGSSTRDGSMPRNAGFRMDFLMLTPDLAPRLAATGVDGAHRGREKPSEHAPVWVELSSTA